MVHTHEVRERDRIEKTRTQHKHRRKYDTQKVNKRGAGKLRVGPRNGGDTNSTQRPEAMSHTQRETMMHTHAYTHIQVHIQMYPHMHTHTLTEERRRHT